MGISTLGAIWAMGEMDLYHPMELLPGQYQAEYCCVYLVIGCCWLLNTCYDAGAPCGEREWPIGGPGPLERSEGGMGLL